jgi:signal transduction histidine kinase
MTVAVNQLGRRGQHWFGADLDIFVVAFAAYYVGAEAAFFIGTLSDKIFAPFWPPNIVLMCALLMLPTDRWWRVILAVLPAHVLTEYMVGMNAQGIAIAFISNCIIAGLNAAAIRYWIGGTNCFRSLNSTSLYVLFTVVLCPAIAAVLGAFVPIATGGAFENYPHYWVQWYASNALGAATLGPFAIITLLHGKEWFAKGWKECHIEAAIAAVTLIAITMIAFGADRTWRAAGYTPALLYLPLPFVLWASVRFGVAGASGSTLIFGAVLLTRLLKGSSFFDTGNAEANVFAIQIFLIGLSVPILLLGAAVGETKIAERSTRDSEERMSFAAASADVGLWVYRFRDGNFWLTDHSRKMLALPAAGPCAVRDILSAIEPADVRMTDASINEAIDHRMPMDCEFRVKAGTGEARWISMRARPHRDAEGSIIEMNGAFVDVTSRKRAEQEASERQQEIAHLMRVSMLGELSGGLAHELTQPLTAILSNAQAGRMLLKEQEPNIEELGNILDDIITADGRAGEVIHRLRMLLKKGDVQYEAVDVNGLIENTINLLHSEFIGRRVSLRRELASDLPFVRGDPVQLQQVVLNLSLNAMDAMDELSPSYRILTFATVLGDDEIEVRISDLGTGLPVMGKEAFKPFFTTKRRGLGLGLSICFSIIKSHGGSLSLTNNEERGATASFRLPPQEL